MKVSLIDIREDDEIEDAVDALLDSLGIVDKPEEKQPSKEANDDAGKDAKPVAGPKVFICDSCVRLCNDIVGTPGKGGD